MTFDDEGAVASTFSPPTDETGKVLSHEEYRERNGCPIGPEEAAALAEWRRGWADVHARTERPTHEDYRAIRDVERRIAPFERRALIITAERSRATIGVPITQAEVDAREKYWAARDAEPRSSLEVELEASRRWSEARTKAFAAAGVPETEGAW